MSFIKIKWRKVKSTYICVYIYYFNIPVRFLRNLPSIKCSLCGRDNFPRCSKFELAEWILREIIFKCKKWIFAINHFSLVEIVPTVYNKWDLMMSGPASLAVISFIKKRPTGLNGHLSIRDFTLTSCQKLICVYQQPNHRINENQNGIGKQHHNPLTQ